MSLPSPTFALPIFIAKRLALFLADLRFICSGLE
jgi:hypothetical protein